MIYTLPYESESLMKNTFFKLRKVMNTETDIIHLIVIHSHLICESTMDIYKKTLKLEGIYRTMNSAWAEPVARVRVINQL